MKRERSDRLRQCALQISHQAKEISHQKRRRDATKKGRSPSERAETPDDRTHAPQARVPGAHAPGARAPSVPPSLPPSLPRSFRPSPLARHARARRAEAPDSPGCDGVSTLSRARSCVWSSCSSPRRSVRRRFSSSWSSTSGGRARRAAAPRPVTLSGGADHDRRSPRIARARGVRRSFDEFELPCVCVSRGCGRPRGKGLAFAHQWRLSRRS